MNNIQNVEDLTIASMFMLSPHNKDELTRGINGDAFRATSQEAQSLAKPIPWNDIQTGIVGAIMDSLQTSVIGAWASAWLKCGEVRESAEESCRSPNRPVPCTLAEHSIESTIHPYVDVMVGPTVIQRIDVDVTLETQILGMILMLEDGTIKSLHVGQCRWLGKIVAQGVELIKRDLTQLELPGRITLKQPIQIVAPELKRVF